MKKKLTNRRDKVQLLRDLLKGKVSVADIPEPMGCMIITENGKVISFTDGAGKTERPFLGIDISEFKRHHTVAIEIPHNGRERVKI